MTKSQLQTSLAETTQTNKKTAALFLDALSSLAYKSRKRFRSVAVSSPICLTIDRDFGPVTKFDEQVQFISAEGERPSLWTVSQPKH